MKRVGNSDDSFGFTIVEIMIAIIVLTILVTITMISYSTITNNAKQQVAMTDAETVASRLKSHKAENGTYPDTASFSGLNLTKMTQSAYVYTYTAGTNSYCLTATYATFSAYITNSTTSAEKGSCP